MTYEQAKKLLLAGSWVRRADWLSKVRFLQHVGGRTYELRDFGPQTYEPDITDTEAEWEEVEKSQEKIREAMEQY